MTEPRALTNEEMRNAMFDHMAVMLKYWRDLPADRLHNYMMGQTELQARMEGFLFSMLVMFDGGTMSTPSFNIAPLPHEMDERFCRDNGENWWINEIINDTQMHEIFPWGKCR